MILNNYIKRLFIKLDKYSPDPRYYSFVMGKNEQQLFDETICKSFHYLEFGLGGSTLRVIKKSKARIYSVESSKEYITQMRRYLIIRLLEMTSRLKVFYIDIGKTGNWGNPIGAKSKELFPGYSSTVFKKIDKKLIDTVLIDGRFRVACALQTIVECYQNERLTILIHDFWRDEYQILLKYLDETDRTGTLAKFKIKKDVDLELVKSDYEQYKFDRK